MTDLQISLIAIGAIIIVAIVVYNKWQENRTKKMLERAFSSLYDDVLMSSDNKTSSQPDNLQHATDSMNADPDFDIAPTASVGNKAKVNAYLDQEEVAVADHHGEPVMAATGGDTDFADEPGFSADLAEPVVAPAPVKRKIVALPVDEIIDARIPIALDTPVYGDKVIPVTQSLRSVGNKPVNFIGCTEANEWEPIQYGVMYHALIAGVQLANRASALNEIEYSELVTKLRSLADSIGGEPDIPDMREVMKEAQRMFQFIADHDAQLGINVKAKSGQWDVKTLVAALTRQGFERYTDGYLMMHDSDGESLFSLSLNAVPTAETTNCLTFLLDVPRIGAARSAYPAMVACAKSIATRLNGVIVDDSNQPLTDDILNDIGEQVIAFYGAMEDAGILAGSKRAQRLFS